MNKIDKKISKLISSALNEDVKNGDITTRATISKTKKAFGKFLVKADCNIAGLEIAKMVLEMEFGLGVVMDMVIVIMPI